MNLKKTNKHFSEGDTVYLKPENDIDVFGLEKYIVIEVKEKTVIIGKGKEMEEVSHLVLLTESEHHELLEKARKDFRDTLN
jgi:hypothetical protein